MLICVSISFGNPPIFYNENWFDAAKFNLEFGTWCRILRILESFYSFSLNIATKKTIMYAKSNFKKELWSTIFTSEPSKSQYKQNGSKNVITLCQSVFLGFNNYGVLLHKINFHCRISMPESLFPHEVFDSCVLLSSIM